MVADRGMREKTRIFAGARKMQKENDVKQNENVITATDFLRFEG